MPAYARKRLSSSMTNSDSDDFDGGERRDYDYGQSVLKSTELSFLDVESGNYYQTAREKYQQKNWKPYEESFDRDCNRLENPKYEELKGAIKLMKGNVQSHFLDSSEEDGHTVALYASNAVTTLVNDLLNRESDKKNAINNFYRSVTPWRHRHPWLFAAACVVLTAAVFSSFATGSAPIVFAAAGSLGLFSLNNRAPKLAAADGVIEAVKNTLQSQAPS